MRVHSHRNVLLVELMIGILFFLLSFSVLLEVFTAAYRQSMESERISRAMLEAQDLADLLYAAEDTETLLGSLGFTYTGGQWILEQDEMTLTAETDTERYGSGMFCRQAVRAFDPHGNVIVELPCSRYREDGA